MKSFVLGDPYWESVYRDSGIALRAETMIDELEDHAEIPNSDYTRWEHDLAARLTRDLTADYFQLLVIARRILEDGGQQWPPYKAPIKVLHQGKGVAVSLKTAEETSPLMSFADWWRQNERELTRGHYKDGQWVGVYQLLRKAYEKGQGA